MKNHGPAAGTRPAVLRTGEGLQTDFVDMRCRKVIFSLHRK